MAWDRVIIGAGSAGCVVAGRLAEAGERVLLVEAGAGGTSPWEARPAGYPRLFGTSLDWGFHTEPQAALAGRRLPWPRGRGVGGSTRINAMIWLRPTEEDLSELAAAGGAAWNAAALRGALEAVERRVQPETARWLSEASERFLAAAKKAGSISSPYPRMNRRGRRLTAAQAMLGDVPPERFALRTDATAISLIFDGDCAVGVRLRTAAGGAEEVRAARGVVLSAGAIGSPALLLHSGVGPRAMLADAGIDCRVDLPEVGAALADHLILPVIFAVPWAARFDPGSMAPLARWQHAGSGPAASNLAECGGFEGGGRAMIQLHVTPTHYLRYPASDAPAAMSIGVTGSRPKSRGRLWLTRSEGGPQLRIDPCYLTEDDDLQVLVEGIGRARQIADQGPLARWRGAELMPGAARHSEASLRRAISRYSQSLFHPVGTCRMGHDAASVVDPQLRVRGVERLRIVDASVLPMLPAANPNALVMALAWRAARLCSKIR